MITPGNMDNKDHIVSQLWFKYFPYWPLFAGLLALGLAGTWFYLLYKTPLYESSANILIKDEKRGLDDSKMIESINLLATKKIIENEIEILHSRSLMREVVEKLDLYAPVFEEGDVIPHSAYSTSPVKIKVFKPDTIKGTKKIYFTYNKNNNSVALHGKAYPLNEWTITPYGMLRFEVNDTASGATKRLFFSLVNPGYVTQALLSRLSITPANKLSTVLNLKIVDEVPARGEDVLNTLIVQYNKTAANDKNLLAASTLSFVEDRLNYVARELDSIEHRIEVYKSEKGAIDIGIQSKLFLQSKGDNDQRLEEIGLKMAVLDQVEQYVVSKNNKAGIVPSTIGISDPLLTQLLEKLNGLELEYEKLKKTTAENNPLLISIADQINKIKPGILENIRSQRSSLEASRINLQSTNSKYSSRLQTIPQKEKRLEEISREHLIKSNIYTFLLQTREQVALANSAAVADSRLIDRAESSPIPVSPNKKLYYIFAMLGAFALGIGILSANEIFNSTILFRRDIETYTGTPIIGEISHDDNHKMIVANGAGNRFIAEQFRRLRAAVIYMGIKGRKNKILVTSSVPREGKSFVAINLALSLASTGKKVVLAEFDLSNPSLSEKLNQFHEKGVADYITGQAEAEDIIRRTTLNENLFFIASGKLPKNPSELIMSRQAEALLAYLDDLFDYVVIDSAPVGPSSDAFILSPMCDLTLYIIRHKFTPKMLIKRMDENNSVTNLKNTAIIFNGICSRGFRKNSYGYGYGYGYEHKYYSKDATV